MSTEALIRPFAAARSGSSTRVAMADVPLSTTSRFFAAAIVGVSGWYLCLPETDLVQIPWWAAKHRFGPNVLIHEILFAIYLVVGGFNTVWRFARPRRYATHVPAVLLVWLAGWTAFTSLLAPYAAHDVGRSARLVLMSLLLVAVTHWAAKDPLFVLRAFLAGLLGGTIANLVLTFQNPLIMAAGFLPRLLGQNSPGPPMGLAVGLAGWLILISRRRSDSVLAFATTLACGLGAVISYSKTGMLAALMGFVGILMVSLRVSPSRRGRILVAAISVTGLTAGWFLRGETGTKAWGALTVMLEEKIASARPGESVSVNERWSYVLGVAEIVARYPLGVGYSGFRDAMIDTDAFRSGRAADDLNIPADESNPHSMFLYYFSAGGLIGGSLAVAIFVLLCRCFYCGLSSYGATGIVLGTAATIAYLVLAISVTYLFNMGVMLIPAAVAAGLHAQVNSGSVRRTREEDREPGWVPA